MSSLRVTVERLIIHEHPNADALELAQVGLYRAVVAKGHYATGDYALYIPEQAVLPGDLIEELGLTGRLAGKAADRVKAVRLRGELSQGIVCRPGALDVDWSDPQAGGESPDVDYGADLGITKWSPPIPIGMSGKVERAPRLLPWPDIENIKRYPGLFEPGEPVVATEKIHGTCCMVTYDRDVALIGAHDSDGEDDGEGGGDGSDGTGADGRRGAVYVTSKGFGAKALSLVEDAGNLYWRAVRRYGLAGVAAGLCDRLDVMRVGLFGEVYGKGVQDLGYGRDAGRDETIGYVLFDIAVEDASGERRWLTYDEIDALCGESGDADAGPGSPAAVPRAPLVYQGPYDYDALAKLAEGRSLLDPGTIREGVVVRPAAERHSDVVGARAIGKIVGEGYLLRKGGTEFE